jgi:uncharacterized protein (DUF697 family)
VRFGDIATDIVRGMILVGFVIGVAVAALVAYSATLAQLRDYADESVRIFLAAYGPG